MTIKVDEVKLDKKELRIDTFRASGPGGQHVNSTDSAVRITHLPSGLTAQCQSERSQHRNKATAMQLIQARVQQLGIKSDLDRKNSYRTPLGKNEWGNHIRSYILHPYRMVKDHRNGYTIHNTTAVLQGHVKQYVYNINSIYHLVLD